MVCACVVLCDNFHHTTTKIDNQLINKQIVHTSLPSAHLTFFFSFQNVKPNIYLPLINKMLDNFKRKKLHLCTFANIGKKKISL